MKKLMTVILVVLGMMLLPACANESDSRDALQKAGFTQIEITGWEPFSCGKDDSWSTGFRATNPQGQKVDGVVCCGLVFKSCTIRF
jgi:hypothetical protein